MANVSDRPNVFEISIIPSTAWPAGTTKPSSGMLQPASSESTTKASPHTEGSDSAQNQVLHAEPQIIAECEEAVDWETIAGYLSRCQSSTHSSLSQSTHSNLDTASLHRPGAINPYRDLLRRSANGIPPSMSKTPSNPPPETTPAPPPASMASSGLSTGAKAAIVGGAAVGIVIILASLVALHTHRRKRKYSKFRTSGRNQKSSINDPERNFAATGDAGEGMPMMYNVRGAGTGLGIEGSGGPLSPEFVGGNTPLMNSEYNVSTHSNLDYQASPTMESHRMYNSPSSLGLYRPPSQQTYIPTPVDTSPRIEDPFEQHNQRSRPSHPLSGLSEAIPPPPLQKRMPHSMADYQSAVPLGFANGFVQVEREEDGDIGMMEQPETRVELDIGGHSDSEDEEGPDGDESLPVYEETPATVARPPEKEFRRREEGDDGDESEEERVFETHLTKSDLG